MVDSMWIVTLSEFHTVHENKQMLLKVLHKQLHNLENSREELQGPLSVDRIQRKQ